MTTAPVEPPRPERERVPVQITTHRPRATNLLLGINVLLFILVTLAAENGPVSALLGGADLPTLVFFGAKFNPLIIEGQFWRLVTPIFLHIGLIHLLFNQYALFLFGRQVEAYFGTPRFVGIYLLAGVGGSLASFAFTPAVSAGASGAIFGIIGALAALYLRNQALLGEMGRRRLQSLGGLILINLFLGLSVPGIDNFGHMGGLVAGALLGYLLAPGYQVARSAEPPLMRVVEGPSLLTPWLAIVGGALLLVVLTLLALPVAPTR